MYVFKHSIATTPSDAFETPGARDQTTHVRISGWLATPPETQPPI